MQSFFTLQNEATLISLQQYMKNNIPSGRFLSNPMKCGLKYIVNLELDVADSGALNKFLEDIDHKESVPTPKKETIISKIKSVIKNLF